MVTLSTQHLPSHNHSLQASTDSGTLSNAANSVLANSGATDAYSVTVPNVTLHQDTVTSVGGSLPHENRPPFVTVNFLICIEESGCNSS